MNKNLNVCRICGRALKDPMSKALGVGPVCSGKSHKPIKHKKQKDEQKETLFDNEENPECNGVNL